MKIGVTICEYNPFHNGHLYSLNKIKEELNPDALIVIMSGNFTQRGETAILHKSVRAKHAILAGADIVIELPAVFATAPAEIFAKGAVKLLGTLKGEKTLCFGVESGNKSSILATANALANESEEFKGVVKQMLKQGHSLAKARQLALETLNLPDVDLNLTLTPNNILGLEYTKAIIERGLDMDILPIIRQGGGYKDLSSDGERASAMAIRKLIEEGKMEECKRVVPDFVYNDLPKSLPSVDDAVMNSLITRPKEELALITDCTEGLENRLKALLKDCFTREELINQATTKRYTKTRLSRITLCSLLGITNDFTFKCLDEELYLKVLAVNGNKLDLLSSIAGSTPFIMRKSDADKLSLTAKECFDCDTRANDIYNLATKTKTNEFETKIIKK